MSENRDSEVATDNSEDAADPEVMRLQHEIEEKRAEMSATIGQIEARLEPSEVREKVGEELKHVEDRVRVVVREQLNEAKELVQAELIEAKELLRGEMNEAEEKIRRGLSDAKETVKQDLREAFTGAKQSIRAATLGKVEDLATNLGDKMNETRDTLIDTIRNNPIPAAITGFGLVWLLMNRSKSAGHGSRSGAQGSEGWQGQGRGLMDQAQSGVSSALGSAGSRVSNAARQVSDAASRGIHQAADAAGQAVHSATDAASSLAHRAQDAASHLTEEAEHVASSVAEGTKRGVRQAEEAFQNALQKNPVAVGAAAVALGAVVGFALPRTQGEDRLMGSARDRVLEQAGHVAQEATASVEHMAERALESTKNGVHESSSGASI